MEQPEKAKALLAWLGCEGVRFFAKGTSSIFRGDAFTAYNVPEWFEVYCGVTGEGYSVPDPFTSIECARALAAKLDREQFIEYYKHLWERVWRTLSDDNQSEERRSIGDGYWMKRGLQLASPADISEAVYEVIRDE